MYVPKNRCWRQPEFASIAQLGLNDTERTTMSAILKQRRFFLALPRRGDNEEASCALRKRPSPSRSRDRSPLRLSNRERSIVVARFDSRLLPAALDGLDALPPAVRLHHVLRRGHDRARLALPRYHWY